MNINEMNNQNQKTETYIQQEPPSNEPMIITDTGGMDGTAVWLAAMIIKMTIVLAFVVTTWTSLRILDWLNGTKFKNWLNNADERNKAIYYSTRIMAVVIGTAIVFAFAGGL